MAAFFFHLYAIFPNNIISYIRQECSRRREHHEAMKKAVAPLLGSLRMNPLLIHEDFESELELDRIKNRSAATIAFLAMAGGSLPCENKRQPVGPPPDPWKQPGKKKPLLHSFSANTLSFDIEGLPHHSSGDGSGNPPPRNAVAEVFQLKAELRFERHLRQQYLDQYVKQTRQLMQAEINKVSLEEARVQVEELRRQFEQLHTFAEQHAAEARQLELRLQSQQTEFAFKLNSMTTEKQQLKDQLKKVQKLSLTQAEQIKQLQKEAVEKDRLLVEHEMKNQASSFPKTGHRQLHHMTYKPPVQTREEDAAETAKSGDNATDDGKSCQMTAENSDPVMLPRIASRNPDQLCTAAEQALLISSLTATVEHKDAELVALGRKYNREIDRAERTAEELAAITTQFKHLQEEAKTANNIQRAQLAALEHRYSTIKSINLHLQQRIQSQHQFISRPPPQSDFAL